MKIPAISGFKTDAFHKYLKNTSWLLLARVGSLFIKMLVTAIIIPNYLGGELNGTLNYPMTFLALFIGICTLGTDSLVTRQLIQYPEKQYKLLGSAFLIRLIGGFIAIPICFVTYYWITKAADHAPAASFNQVAIVSSICIFQSIQIIDSFFQSRTQGKYIMFVQIGANIMSASLKLILVFMEASINAFIWMLVIDVLILQLGYYYFYRKQGFKISNWIIDKEIAKDLLKLGWPLAFSGIFVSLYMRFGQLMVDALLGKEQLGIYSTVVQYTESFYFIPVSICAALFPAIMNFRKFQPEIYEKRMRNLYDLMMCLSVFIAGVITIAAPTFYHIVYKNSPEYFAGASVLQINAWAGVFVFLGTASSQYLLAEGLTKIALLRTCLGAIANIVLNYFLIPIYGLVGAAYATIFAQAITVFSLLVVKSTRTHAYVLLRSLLFLNLFSSIIKRDSK